MKGRASCIIYIVQFKEFSKNVGSVLKKVGKVRFCFGFFVYVVIRHSFLGNTAYSQLSGEWGTGMLWFSRNFQAAWASGDTLKKKRKERQLSGLRHSDHRATAAPAGVMLWFE